MARLHLLLSLVPALSAALPSSTFPSVSSPLPLVIWHGLGDNYDADGLNAVGDLASSIHPGTFVYNIRLDASPSADSRASFFGNLTAQLEKVCADLATHPTLSRAPAINALGFSQGGQFLRGYIERCNTPPVRNLLTFGAQHNGISDVRCASGDWLCRSALALAKGNTWSTYVQSHLVPAQYYRETNSTTLEPTEAYLAGSAWLADINNERGTKNATYKAQLARLERFVMVVFDEDETVVPKESGWFSEVRLADEDAGVERLVVPLRERRMYKEDWLGLKGLDEKGALVFLETKGKHMQLDEDMLKDVFKRYLGPDIEEEEDRGLVVQEELEL